LRLSREGGTALIEVRDDGCGMDAQFVRERLFRPFDTTKGNAGMGIGAYESREVVRAHGGDLEVESAPGLGTTMRIRLPCGPVANESSGKSNATRELHETTVDRG
jgi:signal transduction histidine kinase